jgi:hypothetical protein
MAWIIFVVVLVAANYLTVGAQLIGLSNIAGVFFCGEDAQKQGRSKPLLGITISILFQSIVAISLSALVVSWGFYVTGGPANAILSGLIIGLLAIYPSWQARELSNRERVHEPESYIRKGPTHLALPVSLLATLTATVSFMLFPSVLDSVFYPLLVGDLIVIVISAVIMIYFFRALKQDTE